MGRDGIDKEETPMKHCCEAMTRQVELQCEQHPDRFDCGDALIHHSPRYREYGIIVHDGGCSFSRIQFCPWCGHRLPESLRDRWFKELEAMGLDPSIDDIPEKYESDVWYRDSSSMEKAQDSN